MSLYHRPEKNFYILPNKIFQIDIDPYAFKIYSYLMSCAGSKGYCWPSLHTISRVTGIAVSTVKNRVDYLAKRKLISISKHQGKGHYKNNVYTMLSLDNPEVYRDLNSDVEELPLGEDADRRREATVSPVSAVVKNMEHQPHREPLGQRKSLWAKVQKQGISELFGRVQLRVDFEAGERKGAFRPFPRISQGRATPVPQRFLEFGESGLKFGIIKKQWVNVSIFLEPQAFFVCSSDFG